LEPDGEVLLSRVEAGLLDQISVEDRVVVLAYVVVARFALTVKFEDRLGFFFQSLFVSSELGWVFRSLSHRNPLRCWRSGHVSYTYPPVKAEVSWIQAFAYSIGFTSLILSYSI
jgi:hypothetical protein